MNTSLGDASKGVAYGASAEITFDMQPETQYQISASTNAWLLVGATGATAVKQGAGCHPLYAGIPVLVAAHGKAVRCIIVQDTVAGWAHLSEVADVP
jgi:hypothetical protein